MNTVHDIKQGFAQLGYDVKLSNVVTHEQNPDTTQYSVNIVIEGAFGLSHQDPAEWFSFIAQIVVNYEDDDDNHDYPLATLLSAHVSNSNSDPMIPRELDMEIYWPVAPDSMESICSSLAEVCLAKADGTPYKL